MKLLTKKEEEIMNLFWEKGELFVRELRELYPDPKPHFNTLSTRVRILEEHGFLSHKSYGPTYQYLPAISREEYSKNSLANVIDTCFGNSYLNVVSSFVRDEKISVEELRQLLDYIDGKKQR